MTRVASSAGGDGEEEVRLYIDKEKQVEKRRSMTKCEHWYMFEHTSQLCARHVQGEMSL